jgi:hypothetical protein
VIISFLCIEANGIPHLSVVYGVKGVNTGLLEKSSAHIGFVFCMLTHESAKYDPSL